MEPNKMPDMILHLYPSTSSCSYELILVRTLQTVVRSPVLEGDGSIRFSLAVREPSD